MSERKTGYLHTHEPTTLKDARLLVQQLRYALELADTKAEDLTERLTRSEIDRSRMAAFERAANLKQAQIDVIATWLPELSKAAASFREAATWAETVSGQVLTGCGEFLPNMSSPGNCK
jgi:hypothetical protein